MTPAEVRFSWQNRNYAVKLSGYKARRILIPEGTVLLATWSKTNPPKITKLRPLVTFPLTNTDKILSYTHALIASPA